MQEEAGPRPNIVCFITDDTGDCMLGYTGGPVLTPNIDRIAREGVISTQFHCAAPACTPSRYSYLTGRYAGHCPSPRFQKECIPHQPYNLGFNVDLLPGQPNLASVLQRAGYVTGYTGKWHTGVPRSTFHGNTFDPDDDPADPDVARKLREDYDAMLGQIHGCGFDFAEAIAWGNTDNRPLKKLQYHNLEWHTNAALQFIEGSADGEKPFFLTMATTTMHGPHHVKSLETHGREVEYGYLDAVPRVQPSRSSVFQRLADADLEINHHTAGALWMDDAFGVVMRKVEELGLARETIFIWSTDHGMGTISSKFSCYQGGVRIPYCMSWQGRISSGSTCDALIENVDLVPTLLDMVGVDTPDALELDGISRWPQLRGDAADDREDMFFEWGYTRAVRTHRWKYMAWRHTPEQIAAMKNGELNTALHMGGRPGGNFTMHMHPHYFDPDQLYDLRHDPDEQVNLVADPKCAEILRDMRARLQRYLDAFAHPFDLDTVDPFLDSPEFQKLVEASRADRRPYQSYYYKEKAY